MKRRMIATGLALSMMTAALAGCQNSSSSEAGAKASNSTRASAVTSDGKVKLKALYVSHSLTQKVDDMEWVQELEDQCGVEIEWEQIYTDWPTVKSTRLASGDIPDLLFNATIDSDYTTYSGLFQDLSELIEKDAPNIKQMFEEEPDTKVLAQTVEGQIYGVPKFQGKWPETNTVMFINQTWLDNLGLKMPTTFSELKEVLTAFKEQDANGNGDPTDEIPLDFNAYGGNNAWFNSAYSLTNLLGAMGIQLTDWGVDGYFAEDGVIKNYAVDERYKLFMEYLTDLYANGLINANAITNDYSAYQSLSRGNEKGDALVGVVFAWEETDKFGSTLYSQYQAMAPLDYDINCVAGTYDTRWRNDYTGLNMSANRVCMSSKCANKEAAMKFIDAFYDETASVECLFGGITDGCIEKVEDKHYKLLPPQGDTDPGTWKWTSTFADNGAMYIRRDIEIDMSEDMTNALKEREVYKEIIAKASEKDTYPQMFMKYSVEDQNAMAVMQANINNIIDNYWSLWLTGQSDINADWDAYVQSVNAAGLTDVLAIRQKAFDTYLGK